MITPVVLPWPLHSSLEAATRALFDPGDRSSIDFLRPAGEAALVSPESVSWRVFKNPLSLFIGINFLQQFFHPHFEVFHYFFFSGCFKTESFILFNSLPTFLA